MKSIVAVITCCAFLLASTLSSAKSIPKIRGHLEAHGSAKVNLIVPGDTVTIVSVTGDGGDVDCMLLSSTGKLIDKDESDLDLCSFGVFPNTGTPTATDTLIIEDASDRAESYVIEVR